jgi:hypothetical protein
MATTAIELGGGIGKLLKAAALGPQTAQQAQYAAMMQQAQMGNLLSNAQLHGAQANLAQNELAGQSPDAMLGAVMGIEGMTDQSVRPAIAQRLATGQWGGQYAAPADGVGPQMPVPVDDPGLANIARAMGIAQRAQASKTNLAQEADAALNIQKRQRIDSLMQDPALVGRTAMVQAAMKGDQLVKPIASTGYSTDLAGNQGPTIAPLVEFNQTAQTDKVELAANKAETARLKQAEVKPMNEGQSKALLFGSRMREADKVLNTLLAEGTKTSTPGSRAPLIGGLITSLSSGNQQMLDQAKRDFMSAVLRRESGAAISEGEYSNADKQYFPQIGDDAKVIAQKAANRQLAIKGILMEVPEAHRDALQPTAPAAGPVTIKDAAGYASVPSGATYIAPDGIMRKKP